MGRADWDNVLVFQPLALSPAGLKCGLLPTPLANAFGWEAPLW